MFTIEPGQIVSFPTGSLYGHMWSTYYTCFVNQSLMKIEMKINEISSKVLSKVSVNFPIHHWIWKEFWKIIKRFGRNFHNDLYGSLPGLAVTVANDWAYPVACHVTFLSALN